MSPRNGPGATTWAGLAVVAVAAAVLSFAALHDLALACGIGGAVLGVPLAALLPVAVDAAGVVSTRLWLTLSTGHPARATSRAVALSALGLSVVGNGAQHGMAAYGLAPPWWGVVLVSAVPPVALAAVAHLAALVGRPGGVTDTETLDTRPSGLSVSVAAVNDRSAETGTVTDVETLPEASVNPCDRVGELIAAGAGRRRLSRELSISEHEARALLARTRNGAGGRDE